MKKFLRGLFLMAASATLIASPGVSAFGEELRTVRFAGATQQTVTRTIQGVSNAVSVNFMYGFSVADDSATQNSDLNLPDNFTISFNDAVPVNGVATETQTIDLSGLTFTEVGDYKLELREISSSDPDNYPVDTSNVYKILISVRNDSGVLNLWSRGLVATVASLAEDKNEDKADQIIFAKAATLTYLMLENQVQGNMGQLDRYFRFEYEFSNLPAGTVLAVTGQDEVVEYDGQTLRTQDEIVVGETNYIYLKNGQVAMIGLQDGVGQVPVGTRYRVSEYGVTEDYTIQIDDVESQSTTSPEKTAVTSIWAEGDTEAEDLFMAQNGTGFINTREGAVMTGLATTTISLVGLAAVAAVAGCVYYAIAKRK